MEHPMPDIHQTYLYQAQKTLAFLERNFSDYTDERVIFAFDFDGTLATKRWLHIGDPVWENIYLLQEARKKGHSIILWTCRSDDDLAAALDWLTANDIHIDAANRNISPDYITSSKIFAHIYIDDRSWNPYMSKCTDNG